MRVADEIDVLPHLTQKMATAFSVSVDFAAISLARGRARWAREILSKRTFIQNACAHLGPQVRRTCPRIR
jgi:hypothetical protein